MNQPRFLTSEEVERIHQISIDRFGGAAGIRDRNIIEPALASAQNAWTYGKGDLFDVAAGYAFHIFQGQGYLDGTRERQC